MRARTSFRFVAPADTRSSGTLVCMPEGDSLHRIAARLRVLVGERVEAESPNPRGRATGVAGAVDGRLLEAVDAVGKNLLLRFDRDVVVRSHLRMNGRWRLRRRSDPAWRGSPWLVLRGREWEATQWNGPVLALGEGVTRGLGPDLLGHDSAPGGILLRLRHVDPSRLVGDALVDQRVVAGIGNMWLSETLWHARVSPWSRLADVDDDVLESALRWAREAMRASVAGVRPERAVYRRAGRGCRRCGEPLRSRGLGDANRTAYWCPRCQPIGASAEREGFEPSTSGLPPVTP
jgi:endonuclease VIII